MLAALHLPIALWGVVGVAYAGQRWREVGGRMDFIRFSGELFIYFVLIALGGGVLTGFMAMIFSAIGIDIERDMLIAFDMLLVVVLGLLLYSVSARISEFGLSPNRVTALGVNAILLVNLAWSAVLYLHFLRGREPFARLEKWQTDYLPSTSAGPRWWWRSFRRCSATPDPPRGVAAGRQN